MDARTPLPAGTRVLVTGGAGLLGRALLATAPAGVVLHATQRHTPVTGATAHRVDLAEPDTALTLWEGLRPNLVFHTAYTMHAGARDIGAATRNVVAACRATGAALVHLSSDVIFDGEHAPYTEEAAPTPLTEYGRWKAEAEALVRAELPGAAIVRTSLLTQFSPLDPRSLWVADALLTGHPIQLFVDELRCPLHPDDLARQMWELIALPQGDRAGIWHLVGPEAVSRYTLGLLIAARLGLDPAGLTPARSAASPTPRPRDVRLLTARADRMLATRVRGVSELVLELRN